MEPNLHDPATWRRLNPHYIETKPRVSKCGRFVEIDAGKWSDQAAMAERMNAAAKGWKR